jgi:hypothetical protein
MSMAILLPAVAKQNSKSHYSTANFQSRDREILFTATLVYKKSLELPKLIEESKG